MPEYGFFNPILGAPVPFLLLLEQSYTYTIYGKYNFIISYIFISPFYLYLSFEHFFIILMNRISL